MTAAGTRLARVGWGKGTAVVACVAGAVGGCLVPVVAAYVAWAVVLVAASVIDLRERRLPRVLIEPALVIGLAWLVTAGLVHDQSSDARDALFGLGLMLVLLGIPHLLAPGKLAFGDVRFGGLIGLFIGWLSVGAVPIVLLVGTATAALAGVAMVRRWKGQVPLGPFLAVAAIVVALAVG